MEEDETIATYFLQVYEVVNNLRGLGEIINELSIVDKILRTPPMRLDTKVFVLEERKYLYKITMNALHGTLNTYKMRTKKKQSPKKEFTLKDSQSTKKHMHTSKTSSSEESDEEEPNFVKKMTRGFRKHKCKLPFQSFNCGKIGHLA